MTLPLAGCKIAVLVESQYIPQEIKVYREGLAALGAEVQLITRLWGKARQTFVSEVEDSLAARIAELRAEGKTADQILEALARFQETLDVEIDIDAFFLPAGDPRRIELGDYAAVIMSANYTSVRLRHFAPPYDMRTTPAVRLFAEAMENPRIIKGALCHGLWILTPRPDLLKDRRVTCHEVVAADVVNAGAQIVNDPSGVVVDGDLVTGKTYKEAAGLAMAIKHLILAARPVATSR